MGHDQPRRPAVGALQHPAEDELLHIAARQRPGAPGRRGTAQIEGVDDLAGIGQRRAAPHPAPARQGGRVQGLGAKVLPDGQVTHHADGLAVFGHPGHALCQHRLGLPGQRLAVEPHAAGTGLGHAAQEPGQQALAVARDAGDAQHLAGVDLQGDALQMHPVAAGAELPHCQPGRAARGPGARRPGLALQAHHRLAHHPAGQLGLAGVGGAGLGHGLAAAQHLHPLRDRHHLVELVADEDHRHALRQQLALGVEQADALLRCQHRRGLVQHQHPGAAVQGFQDLHPLARAHRQVGHRRTGIYPQAGALGHLAQAGLGQGATSDRRGQRLGAQHHVVQHRQVVGQREVLVHHAHPGGQRGAGVARRQWPAEHFDLPGIGQVVTEQHDHQPGFAGAVLAQQGQHLAGAQVQRDVVVGQQITKALGDALQAQDRGSHPWRRSELVDEVKDSLSMLN